MTSAHKDLATTTGYVVDVTDCPRFAATPTGKVRKLRTREAAIKLARRIVRLRDEGPTATNMPTIIAVGHGICTIYKVQLHS